MSSGSIPAVERGVRPALPEGKVSWGKLCITIIALLAIVLGALSVAEVGLLRHVGAWGWLAIGAGAIGQLVCCAVTGCQKPPTGVQQLHEKIETAAWSSLKPLLSKNAKPKHFYTSVFLFLKPKNSDLVESRNFVISGKDNFRQTLASHLRQIKDSSLTDYNVEYVCITKSKWAGIDNPTYTVKHDKDGMSHSATWSTDSREELAAYLTDGFRINGVGQRWNIGTVQLKLLPNFRFPVNDLT